MAFNPFLSMGEPAAPVATEALNPFMMTEEAPVEFSGDNPFATSNPFSDFAYEPPAGDTVPADIFTEPNGGAARHFDEFAQPSPGLDLFGGTPAEAERLVKPTELELVSTTADFFSGEETAEPAPPSRPLPPETQNLILTVTGQMEFTSSHLLDRIPPTRTPSPVSARDIHSPSPTPEPEPLPLDAPPPRPARPPPARPPRPAPPPARPAQHSDDINLFDAPIPVQVKPTKEDIMSLYSAPKKEVKQVDFLSDDLLDDLPSSTCADVSSQAAGAVSTVAPSLPAEPEVASEPAPAAPSALPEPAAQFPPAGHAAPMDCSEPLPESSPFASNTSPFADVVNDDFTTAAPRDEEMNPFETSAFAETASPFASANANIFGVAADTFPTHNTDSFAAVDNDNFGSVSNAAFEKPANNIFGTAPTDAFGANDQSGFSMEQGAAFEKPASNIFGAAPTDAFGANDQSGFSMEQGAAFEKPASNIFGAATTDAFGANDQSGFSMEQGAAFEKPASNMFGAAPTDAFGASNPSSFGIEHGATTAAPASVAASWDAAPEAMAQDAFPESQDAFDAFSAKFDSTAAKHLNSGAWGEDSSAESAASGFEAEAFDPFLHMSAPPPAPAASPRRDRAGSQDSGDDTFSLFIRPKENEGMGEGAAVPALAPPPRPQALPESPRANPFDKTGMDIPRVEPQQHEPRRSSRGSRGSGGETPPTPLFDDDVSQPLEDFPRTKYTGPGWEMQLRQPIKKKITGQRFWKKVWVRVSEAGGAPVLQLLKAEGDREPYQELPLQACYSVSEVGAQQFDTFGKIFTVKLQYVFYKERPGVRPGQVTKAERITNKLSQFAAYAIQGDYQGVKEFGSDLRKLGLPVEHAPQVSQLFKFGSLSYEDVIQLSCCVEEALFRLAAHRDRALHYKMEEVQVTAVDELYVEQDFDGVVQKQIARVRIFFLGFLSGMPDIELGVNDLRRQGREVVGRHDIIPVVTEEWIRVEDAEFHACVVPEEFYNTQIIKFKPPDACYIELLRFRIRPPKNRELPLQLKAVWCVTGNKVELRADVLVPGFASRKLGQVPCEDVAIRFPIPECWIYLFRIEKHHRYGSVKSAHRRTGKIKGIERFLGAVDTLSESLIEVTSGQAKYEHQHRALVWRMPRLPKEGQGAYTTHNLVCRMALTSYDQVPAELARAAHVSFTMPHTTVSHVTVRSVSLQNHERDDPPEKYVRYLARHEYLVGIERTTGAAAPASAYAAAAAPRAPPPAPAPPAPAAPSSDSDSD